ncbi:MAG: elongation factor G [Actinomycetota bacterium]|jgi:elongation factor G|nr:elongation factor G [Actinomycetota bacterium]
MKAYSPAQVRNVALVGHGGSGKTTLAEAMLLCSGAVSRAGKTDDGTAVLDFEPEEHSHHMSTSLGLAALEWRGYKINVLDCPGYADFVPEALAGLAVADIAIVVVSAVDGVEVQTEVLWRAAAELGIPRLVFLNKLDRERSDFSSALQQVQKAFGAGIAPLELPIGQEHSFSGVVDLLTDTAFTYAPGKHTATAGPIPAEIAEREHAEHDAMVEGIVVADDDLTARYLEGEEISTDELAKTLAKGVVASQVFPVVCGSGASLIGVDRLLDAICDVGPSPLERPPARAHAPGSDEVVEVPCDPAGSPLAQVFKTVADPYVGKISLFRVTSGTVRPDAVLYNPRGKAEERLHALFTLRGKEQLPLTEIAAGDIGAVAKLASTNTTDTLTPRNMPVEIDQAGAGWLGELSAPVLSVAIRPKSKADEDKLMTALHRLQEEDPSLSVRRDDETHQTVLSGTGETHLAISMERLARKFGVAVETEDLVTPYRETVTSTAEAEGKYKKQTGGHGQFGVASLRIEPMERGGGFEFVDNIVGGVIPRQYIPAVQKGAEEALGDGGAFGWPVVDVRVTCFDGKSHPVDSSELSFKMAGALAVREALAKASPVVLEPLSLLEVTVPDSYQGDVLGDLNSRRGRVQGTETAGTGESLITALVPTAEIVRYAIDLRSLTGGRGRFKARHSHYEVMPSNFWDKVRRERAGTEK